jgi:cytochrome c oxidase subunit 2
MSLGTMPLDYGADQTNVGVNGNVTRKPEGSKRPQSRTRGASRRFAAPAVLALVVAACSGSGPQSSLEPQGPIAQDIDGLWELVLILATIVFVLVMIAFVISIIRFRERKNHTDEPVQVHGNTRLEIVWTIIPAVILAVLTVPSVEGIFDLRTPPEGPDVLDVQVTGHQWWWEFVYPDIVGDDGRPLVTANELHIPAGTPISLTMTSSDVIHSFWVPPLNGKRDVVPGRITRLTLNADPSAVNDDTGFGPGVILGQCAEFCGLAHADMRMRVFVETPSDFDAWAQGQLAPSAVPTSGAAAAGYETFNQVCTACHQSTVMQPDGTVETIGLQNTLTVRGGEFYDSFGPNLTHFGGRTTFGGASFVNDVPNLAVWLHNPSDLKPMLPDRNDVANRVILGMPNFGLSDEEVANLLVLLEEWD